MILALDVGNTNIVLGCMTNEEVYFLLPDFLPIVAKPVMNMPFSSGIFVDYGTSIWKK